MLAKPATISGVTEASAPPTTAVVHVPVVDHPVSLPERRRPTTNMRAAASSTPAEPEAPRDRGRSEVRHRHRDEGRRHEIPRRLRTCGLFERRRPADAAAHDRRDGVGVDPVAAAAVLDCEIPRSDGELADAIKPARVPVVEPTLGIEVCHLGGDAYLLVCGVDAVIGPTPIPRRPGSARTSSARSPPASPHRCR